MNILVKIINKYISGWILLIGIFVPFIINIFNSNTQLLDNRPLFTKPNTFSKSFFKDYERYYNDTITYRRNFVETYSMLYSSFSMIKGVFFDGKKDYMFLALDRSIKDYLGIDFTDGEKQSIKNYITKVSNFCKGKNIKYLFVSIPNKERIYSEFIPKGFKLDRLTSTSAVDKVLSNFEKNGIALNLINSLIESKLDFKYPLYYKKNTHWTHWGAYIGFLKVLNVLGYDLNLPQNPTVKISNEVRSDMGMINYKEKSYTVEIRNEVILSALNSNDSIMHYRSEKALINKKVLIIRDSFSEALMQYFSKIFSEVIFVHWMKCKDTISEIKKYKPDIVIDQTVERCVLNRSKL